MTPEEYVENQKASGLKRGDRVLITRSAQQDENGWFNDWVPEMDRYVGQHGEIMDKDLDDKYGIRVKVDGKLSFCYPYFVLQKIDQIPKCTSPSKVIPILKKDASEGDRLMAFFFAPKEEWRPEDSAFKLL